MRVTFRWLLCMGVVLAAEPREGRSATLELVGPNGSVRCLVSTDASGHLQYSVSAAGEVRFAPAPIGITIEGMDCGADVELGPPVSRRVCETFPWRGNKSLAVNDCVAYEIPVHAKTAGPSWVLEVRMFNDGAALRQRVPGEGQRRVAGESTAFQFPPGTTLWLQQNTSDYEGDYHACAAEQVPLEVIKDDKSSPGHFGPPVTAVYADGSYGLLSEAALHNYSGMTLRPQGGGRFGAAFEDDAQGWVQEGPIVSPWRVMLWTDSLNGLVNSDVIPALCDPPDPQLFPDGMNTAWIRAGKAPCTWMVYGNDGAQWERQKWWVDKCAATGCEFLLVDAGWRSERWGWLKDGGDVWARAAELCRYAAERHVGIILWHSYPEGRDDSPGLTTIEAREEFFRHCQQAGVQGVKIDFFNSESKVTIDAYEDLLRRAAKYQLIVSFHGANKPTGEARTWPNEITREGIREQEYVLWDALPLPHYGALPFTRMAVGHADFLPGYVQSRHLKNTTVIFQMASTVVFSSPFLCWPDNPDAYLNTPLLPLIRTVPVMWDETRVLPGSAIGDTVVFARRHGESWYVAALNCRAGAQELELDLTPLNLAGLRMTTFKDNDDQGCQIQTDQAVPADGKLTISLRSGGGFLARLAPPVEYPGW